MNREADAFTAWMRAQFWDVGYNEKTGNGYARAGFGTVRWSQHSNEPSIFVSFEIPFKKCESLELAQTFFADVESAVGKST